MISCIYTGWWEYCTLGEKEGGCMRENKRDSEGLYSYIPQKESCSSCGWSPVIVKWLESLVNVGKFVEPFKSVYRGLGCVCLIDCVLVDRTDVRPLTMRIHISLSLRGRQVRISIKLNWRDKTGSYDRETEISSLSHNTIQLLHVRAAGFAGSTHMGSQAGPINRCPQYYKVLQCIEIKKERLENILYF